MTLQEAPDTVVIERSAGGRREFVAIVTALMALAALATDMVLPAFPEIRSEFGMPADSSRVSWIVTAFFLGLALGPLVYGPLSDRFGRRRPLFVGLALYALGGFLAAFAPSFGWMVIARVIGGLGAAAPRSLSLAMIRDRYEGDRMARLMSMIMAVFLLVPIVAPSLGAVLAAVTSWRVVLVLPALIGLGVMGWVVWRLPETLPPAHRRPFTASALGQGFRAVVTNPQTVCFTIGMMFMFGILTTYLGSSELIIEDVYGYGKYFPLLFAVVGMALACTALNNARLVGRLGVDAVLLRTAVIGVVSTSVLAVVSFVDGGRPNFWLFAVMLCCTVPVVQGLLPNSNTKAMAPMAHVAGMASAITALVTTAGGAVLGAIVSSAFDGTVRPFAIGILVCMWTSAAMVLLGVRSRAAADRTRMAKSAWGPVGTADSPDDHLPPMCGHDPNG